MTGNNESNPLLVKVLDQLYQLFDLASRIDAKTNQLETKQEQMASNIKGIQSTNDSQNKTLAELKLKVNTIDTVHNETARRREQRFNWILSLLLIIVSSICSYLLYLVR